MVTDTQYEPKPYHYGRKALLVNAFIPMSPVFLPKRTWKYYVDSSIKKVKSKKKSLNFCLFPSYLDRNIKPLASIWGPWDLGPISDCAIQPKTLDLQCPFIKETYLAFLYICPLDNESPFMWSSLSHVLIPSQMPQGRSEDPFLPSLSGALGSGWVPTSLTLCPHEWQVNQINTPNQGIYVPLFPQCLLFAFIQAAISFTSVGSGRPMSHLSPFLPPKTLSPHAPRLPSFPWAGY